jgi:hypothetical protein
MAWFVFRRMVRVGAAACGLLTALLVVAGAAAASSGTVLIAALNASGHLASTYGWTIQKSASPASQVVAVGSSGSVQYSIATTKTAQGSPGGSFRGQVCVANIGPVATQGLAITDALSKPPSSSVLAAVAIDVSAKPVLAARSGWCYSYAVAVPTGVIAPGARYQNTAHVTITNQIGRLGSPAGPSPSTTASLPRTPTLVDSSITVTDSNGQTFTFNSAGTQSYSQIFSCPTAAGAHTIVNSNTATIQSTGQSASAQATIHCAAPTTLSATPSASTIAPGGTASAQATITGADPAAGGTINYAVYSDSACSSPFADATPTNSTVTNAAAPPSAPIAFSNTGTYYWQAVYSGDPSTNTLGSTSNCSSLTVAGWQTGAFTTYNQNHWPYDPAALSTLNNDFNNVYTTGSVAVGGTFTMRFTSANTVLAYLPATGTPAQLNSNLVDSASSPSGAFGGDVLSLQLDVDFSDAGALSATSGLKFGNLTVCNLTTVGGDDVSSLNGMTVRQLLATANTILGGGSTTLPLSYPVDDSDMVVRLIVDSFLDGTPSTFAQANLVNGPCT